MVSLKCIKVPKSKCRKLSILRYHFFVQLCHQIKEVNIVRGDVKDKIEYLGRENLELYNKAELARRFDCDPRTIDRYIRICVLTQLYYTNLNSPFLNIQFYLLRHLSQYLPP